MELRDYLRVISVRRWIVIQAVVVVTAAAAIASLLQRPIYEAESVLLVKERSAGSSIFGAALPGLSIQPERSIQTHVKLLKMPAIAEGAARRVASGGQGRVAPEELLSELSVDVDPQTNLIYVKVQDASPRRAVAIADAVARQYAASNRALNTAEIENAREEVSFKLRDTEEDIYTLGRIIASKGRTKQTTTKRVKVRVPATRATAGATGTAAGRTVTKLVRTTTVKRLPRIAVKNAAARLRMAMGVYQMLASKEEELKISRSMEPGETVLIQRAQKPGGPVKPTPARNTVLGLVLGLSLGVGMAFLIEYLDNTIKTPEDVEHYFHLPLLGQIPINDPELGQKAPPLVVTPGAKTNAAEAYRALRTSLSYLDYEGKVKTILVTSGKPGEGKTSVVVNLGTALAHAGQRVLVIDCDLRKPKLHRTLGLMNSKGLTSVLAGKATLEEAVQKTGQDGLHVITSGPVPPNPSELLNSSRMDGLLRACAKVADVVFLDSPPVLAVTDCAVLAPKADGVLIAAAVGETGREEARRVVEVLSGEPIRLLGVVLNKVPVGGRYGYYYYYSYDYAPDTEA